LSKCERLSLCVVTGMSDAPVPWPEGRKNGRVSVLLMGDLVEAGEDHSSQAG
jgi:hypothetical protein